jgi:hypothetical protein
LGSGGILGFSGLINFGELFWGILCVATLNLFKKMAFRVPAGKGILGEFVPTGNLLLKKAIWVWGIFRSGGIFGVFGEIRLWAGTFWNFCFPLAILLKSWIFGVFE